MGVLQLLDADETTVLFDFHDPTGAANSEPSRRSSAPRWT
jgi:hypothetical protein